MVQAPPLPGEAAHHDLSLHCEEEEDTEVDHQHRPEDRDVKEPEEGHAKGHCRCHHHSVPAPGEAQHGSHRDSGGCHDTALEHCHSCTRSHAGHMTHCIRCIAHQNLNSGRRRMKGLNSSLAEVGR